MYRIVHLMLTKLLNPEEVNEPEIVAAHFPSVMSGRSVDEDELTGHITRSSNGE